MKKQDSLGDRMKRYEQVSRQYLVKKMPVIIRLDGKAFHTLTKRYATKPFDCAIMDAMSESAMVTLNALQGAKVAYIQSDEVTFLLTDYENINTEAWFDYIVEKLVSISAATMSVEFNGIYLNDLGAVFDSRAFNVPKEDVINNFLWRAKDWKRNSLQMYCRSHFSHKQLRDKKTEDMHNMLFDIGLNWTTDLTDREKNGRFIIKGCDGAFHIHDNILPTYDSIKEAIVQFL